MEEQELVRKLAEEQLLSWIKGKTSEGLAILDKEKSYKDIQKCIEYMDGDQAPTRSRALSSVYDNRIKKIVLEIVSSLTDVRPIWNYETNVEEYKEQGEILNKLARAWWKNNFADRKLQRVLTYSCVGGSGYLYLRWNEELPGGGDIEAIPLDPRDVIPIDPVFSDTIQDWRGVIVRRRLPVETVRGMFPSKQYEIVPSTLSWVGEGRSSKSVGMVTAMWDAIVGKSALRDDKAPNGAVDLLYCFLKDETSIHTGDAPKQMGRPDSNWQYTVYPVGSIHPGTGKEVTKEEARLFPRGRLVICTATSILEDGPNPYWHGMFPLVKFSLDQFPWSLLGSSIVSDLMPLQDALNEGLRGAEDGMAQWIRRGLIADKQALSRENLNALDTRKSGLRAHLNPSMGEGFKILDGPTFPDWYMEMLGYLRNEMDELSGVKFLQAAAGAQAPNLTKDATPEEMQNMLSPLLRVRSRSIEVSLGELAEMLKVNFFQYYHAPRRMQILGKSGLTLEDFDYDPGTMVPADLEGDSEMEKAKLHHKNFTFAVASNSFLNISHMTHKMLILQLFRANGIDIYTLWDTLDLSGTGPAPAETIPERMVAARKLGLQPGPTPELVQAQEAVQLAQAQAMLLQLQTAQAMGAMSGALGAAPPNGGAPPGGGPPGASNSGVGPQGGRPPSGQQPPQMVTKQRPGGPSTVISESGS